MVCSKHLAKIKIWIDLTSSPTLMRRLAKEFEDAGGYSVDAPITGSLDSAIRGDMIMFVGGSDIAVRKSKGSFRHNWQNKTSWKIWQWIRSKAC